MSSSFCCERKTRVWRKQGQTTLDQLGKPPASLLAYTTQGSAPDPTLEFEDGRTTCLIVK